MYYELTPAYGRDYKTSKEVKQAWAEGKDFEGDYSLQFKAVNIGNIPKPCTVNLRYKRNTQVASVKVPIGAMAQAATPKPEKKMPSTATMQHWLFDGIAKATDGCEVEPDGHCEHGKPSWLLVAGVI